MLYPLPRAPRFNQLWKRYENGALAIRNGFTHYPQKQETYRFFRGDLEMPTRIILLDCSGSISFDVLSWLTEQNVPLIRIDWRGEVICVVSADGYPPIHFAFNGSARRVLMK